MTTEMANEGEKTLKQRSKNKEPDNQVNAATDNADDSNEIVKKTISRLERNKI